MTQWTGTTEEVILPQLSSEFWSEGTSVKGTLSGFREVQFRDANGGKSGIAYRLELATPITINGESHSIVELPPLTGLSAAFKALKNNGYSPRNGDVWTVKCTGVREAKRENFSDSPNFSVQVERD